MDFEGLARRLNERIRPRTAPLGVRLLRKEERLPDRVITPAKYGIRISLCQWTTLARTWKRTAGVLAADINCSPCLAALGLERLQDDQGLAQYFMDMGYFETAEAAKRAAKELGPVEAGAFHGVLMFPLEQSGDLVPDLVWIYGTPARMARLAAGWVYKTGELVSSATTGFGISCLAMVKPFFTQRPAFVHPGRGERILAGTDEEEMAFSFPAGKLMDLVEGLEKTHEKGNRYPIQKFVIYEPPLLKPMETLREKLSAS